MRIEIETMPQWRDEITVKTWIISLENSRSVRALEVFLGEKKIIGCETFWAVINTKLRRPEPLALPFQHFELFPNDFSTNERIKKNIITNENAQTNKRKIVLSDLDIVNHVNNVKYLEWCLDFANPEKVLNQKIKCLNMNFLSELMLNEEIAISAGKNGNSESFLIIKSEKICFSMVLDSLNIL
jgi:hypothetical protein